MQNSTNISSTFSEYCTGYYGFGFNGQEKDQEIYNNQSTTTATFWEYDGRIGRRWNVDQLTSKGPYWSPYSTFGNSPIIMIDIDGKWPGWVHERIIRTAFQGILSETDIKRLITSSIATDRHQKPSESYMHSMRDGKADQSKEEAQSLQKGFVSDNINLYINDAPDGANETNGIRYLGNALHAIADEDAPSHNWKSWGGMKWYNPFSWIKGAVHLARELNVFHISEKKFNTSVEKIRNQYIKAKREKDNMYGIQPMTPKKLSQIDTSKPTIIDYPNSPQQDNIKPQGPSFPNKMSNPEIPIF